MRSACPSIQYFALDIEIIRSHHPVGGALHHRIAECLEAGDSESGGRRPEGRSKTFVCALVHVHRGSNRRIERIRWNEFSTPVIAQGRVKWNRARRYLDN